MTKKSGKFDLSALDTVAACNKPFEFEIKHPVSGIGIGIFISVVGKDSDAYRSRVRAMADDQLRRSAMGKSASDVSLDKLEAKNIDALVAATVGWRTADGSPMELDGEALEFSNANVRAVYSRLHPIREQVSEAIAELGNFMPA